MSNPWEIAPEEIQSDIGMIPKGDYLVQVERANAKQTDKYLAAEMMLRVIEGEYEGRVVFDFMIVQRFDGSDGGVSYGRSKFGKLCGAADIKADQPEDLVDAVVIASVKQGKAKDGYDAKNEVTGYKKSETDSFDTSEPTAW